MRFILKILPCAVLLSCTFSQSLQGNNHQYMFISAQYHYHYLWPHRYELKPLIGDTPVSYEFKLGWRTSGALPWHRTFNMPSYGLGFASCDLGNPDELGEASSGFFFMEFDLGRREVIKRKLIFSLGLSYLNRYYHPERNPVNRFIGTPWNVRFNVNYSWSINFLERIMVLPGVSFTHYSNGAYRKPNRGLNMFDVNLGLRYIIPGGAHIQNNPESDFYTREYPGQDLIITYSLGIMQREEDDPVFKARSITFNNTISRQEWSAWGIGLDLFYDDHAREGVRQDRQDPVFIDYTRIGGFASYDVTFNRLSIFLNLGTYLYYGYEPLGSIYKRAGLRYTTNSGLLGHFAIKAHAGRADYFEWGIGYRIGY